MQTAEMRETGGGLPLAVMLFSAKVPLRSAAAHAAHAYAATAPAAARQRALRLQAFKLRNLPPTIVTAQAFSHSFLACLRISNLLQFLSR